MEPSWEGGALGLRLRLAAEQAPEKTAYVDDHGPVTYAELLELTCAWRAELRARGVAPGDPVAWQLPNCVESAAIFLAVLDLGAVAVPVVPIYRRKEVSFICGQTGAKLLFVPGGDPRFDFAAGVADDVPSVREVVPVRPGSRWPATPAADPRPDAHTPASAREVAVVVYTSGTESNPKGVLHSQATLLYEVGTMQRFLGLSGADVFFMPSPLAHITGLLNGIITPISLGGTTVLQEKWDAATALRLVERHGCTYSVMATPFLQQMFALPGAREALRAFRYVRCGGADIPRSLMDAAAACEVTVLRVYGLSEIPTVTCTRPEWEAERLAGTDGVPLENIRLRVLDEDDRELPSGTPGHIVAAGPEMFLGYLDPVLNEGAFTAEGLFRTGDLGVLDADGRLRITGRAKDIIVRGGENISAMEVEEALRKHPSISDVAVVGVPDPVMGQRACAYLVTGDALLGPEELRAFLTGTGLAIQKSPEHVVRVDELPRTPAGKVKKEALRASFSERTP
ncbi:AMP-binding protein [Actinocorallia sp. B10E7]